MAFGQLLAGGALLVGAVGLSQARPRRRVPRCGTWAARHQSTCARATEGGGGAPRRTFEICGREEAPTGCFEPAKGNSVCVCGVQYQDFRSGWKFADAYEQIAFTTRFRPSRRRILNHMGRLKRDEWIRHQQACAFEPGPEEDIVVDPAEFLDGWRPRFRRWGSGGRMLV